MRPPRVEALHAFCIPHGGFVKLNKGTWHAGPLFDDLEHRDFLNLELTDTNLSDGNDHDLGGTVFEVVD